MHANLFDFALIVVVRHLDLLGIEHDHVCDFAIIRQADIHPLVTHPALWLAQERKRAHFSGSRTIMAEFERDQPPSCWAAPEPRRAWRGALRALARERGDISALESPLTDYHRLRVGGYRIIFAYRVTGKRRSIQCIYAERRDAVYEVFARLLKKHLLEGEKQ